MADGEIKLNSSPPRSHRSRYSVSLKIQALLRSIVSVVVGLSLGLLVTAVAGENPIRVLGILAKGSFGSVYDFSMTLFYSAPLVLSGLSVAMAFQCGLFNIGAEGQLTASALAAAAAGIAWKQSFGLNLGWVGQSTGVLFCLFAGFLAGAFVGWIPGILKAKRQSHEVINTIMLNFIVTSFTSWVALYWLKNPDSQNPETAEISRALFFAPAAWAGGAPLSYALLLAPIAVFVVWWVIFRTRLGSEIRAVGANPDAARAGGISVERTQIIAMTLAGAIAASVGVIEVLGNSAKFKVGFSPGFGFTGIAVALLGRNHPVGVLASGLLFGALHKGSGDLDFETENVTRDLAQILQALVILSVCAEGLWRWIKWKR